MKALLCTIPLDIGFGRSGGDLPIMPKIAIVSLIKWMEYHGFTRDEYDFYDIDMLDPSDEEIRAYFKSCQPTVIGLSAVVSTMYMQVKRIAQIAREVCPDAWIVMGGNLAASANVLLRKTEVDLCVQSDGENPWVEFLNHVKKYDRKWNYDELQKIKGLSYIDPHGELQFNGYPVKIPAELNPYPDYDVLALGLKTRPQAFENYFREARGSEWFRYDPRSEEPHRGKRVAGVWTGKGCVARCTFCHRFTKGYEMRSVTTLDDHLKILKEKYDVGFIHVLDENFAADKKQAYEFARMFKKHDLLWIATAVRCVSVNKDDIKFYQEHNCSALKFGVESGSQKMLDIMEKRFTVEDVYTALKNCYKLGMFSPLGLMIGMPGETTETVRQTGVYWGKIARMIGTPPGEMGIGLFHALPIPGTPLYQYGQQVGKIGRSVDEEEKYLIAISDLATEKDNFINLNGSPMKDVLFWEFLMRYEATRTYYSKPLGDDCITDHFRVGFQRGALPTQIHGVEHSDEQLELRKFYPALGSQTRREFQAMRFLAQKLPALKDPRRVVGWLVYNTCKFKLITTLNYVLVFSPLVAKIPRPLVEIPMKNLLYLEYLLRKALRKLLRVMGVSLRDRNLFNDHNFPKPILDKDLQGFDRTIQRSLRHIVDINRKKLFHPETTTDINQEVLNMGR